MKNESLLPVDSGERKDLPVFTGVLQYFPLALLEVARVSKIGNDKHNPGEPLHWAREKSKDHGDCIVRHQIEFDKIDADNGGEFHAAAVAWRALAQLQLLEEARKGSKSDTLREQFLRPKTCSQCHGHGVIEVSYGRYDECFDCNGKGLLPA